MHKPLTKQQLVAKTLRYKPCAILMGQTGAGKTTLSNKLCGTQHQSGAAKGSVTQNLYRNDVSCGENAFSIIDTPGTDSTTEAYKHAILLKDALTATNINTIFIIIKYNNRFDKMVDNYAEVSVPVSKYVHKIVVMISHMDVSENATTEFKDICESFEEEYPGVKNIIFFSAKSSENEVADLMYSCMSNMELEMLTITDEEFHLNFNIYQMKSQIKTSFKQYQTRASQIVKDYTDLINTVRTESVEDKDEKLHMMIVEFKYEIEALFNEFTQKHGVGMIELDYYVFSIKMQKENVKICDDFAENVAQFMSYNLFDNKDPRNFIKMCPHCGLIWFKTEGCDGATTCGERVSTYYDVSSRAVNIYKYALKRINGKLHWEKNSVQELSVKQAPKSASLFTKLFPHSKKVGCGKTIVWSELPKLDDELILELYKVKTIAEAIELIKADEFKEARQNYESNINRDFLS